MYILGIALILTVSQSFAQSMEANINDPAWNGKQIPKGLQCNKFGGKNPMSPEIKITGIPEGTEAILLRFSDESFQRMKNGGHGVVAMLLEA